MSKNFKSIPLLLSLLLCFSTIAFGQETNGAIEVTVRDQAGAVVPNVSVTVASSTSDNNAAIGGNNAVSTGFRRTLNTDDNGFQRFLEVPPGIYTVSTEAVSGFGTATINNVQVVLGKNTPVNVELGAGGQSVTVDVNSDDVVSIDPTDSKLQTNITAQVAELLPKGTNFQSLLKVAPAARNEPLSGGIQIDGASGSENTFIIDGQEVTNYRTGVLNDNNDLPFQIIQEVQVKSSGFEAEFGGATGGVVNLVTKGGSNDFRGEFGIQFRPQKLRASPRGVLILNPANPNTQSEYLQFNRDGGLSTYPTGTLGGRIVKDKVWFFTSYTPQVFNFNRTINYLDPLTRASEFSETYRSKLINQYAFARIDAQPISKLRVTGTFTYNPQIQEGILPLNLSLFDGVLPSNSSGTLTGSAFQETLGGRQNANNTTVRAVYTPTSNLVITAGGGRQFLNEKLNSYGVDSVAGRTRISCLAGVGAPPVQAGCSVGQSNGVVFQQQLIFDASKRDTFDTDITYIANFGGRHEFKGGFSVNRISNELLNASINQVILRYGRPIGLTAGRSNLVSTPGAIGSGFIRRFSEIGDVKGDNQGIFIQDKYQPTRRLTLNIGLRTERETIPSFNSQASDLEFGFGDKLAPRIGGAFDLTGDGKTKVSAFYGWFYDRFKYELPRGSFGGQFFRDDFFEIFPNDPAAFSFTSDALLGSPTDPIGGSCPNNQILFGRIRCQIDRRIPSNAGLGLNFGAVDPDIQAFRQSEFTVNFERDLGRNFVAAARYTRKNVDRAIEDVGFLTATGGEAYVIGNPGRGLAREVADSNGFLSVEPQRQFDAFEVRLDRRFANSYYFNLNYTYSRLYGNYSGLASSDEDGRTSPNVNRFYDLPIAGFTAAGTPDNGRLPTDRPHALKFAGAYSLNYNDRFGFGGSNTTEFQVFSTVQSGTPLTTVIDILGIDTIPLTRRGDLGRTDRFSETDFAIRHRYRFGRDNRFTLVGEVDALNVFNQAGELNRFSQISTNSFGLTESQLGLVTAQETTLPVLQQEALGIARLQRRDASNLFRSFIDNPALGGGRDPRYQLTNVFQAPRQIRFGFRLLF